MGSTLFFIILFDTEKLKYFLVVQKSGLLNKYIDWRL